MMALSHLKEMFGRTLLEWHRQNPRPLPWKETRDPYKIWLSEIILQQTQVAQGIPYYKRFIESFPTVQDLAAASEDEVLKLWQGLGYNSRARNLHKAAATVAEEMHGYFPDSRDELIKLAGVGNYTSAAIASFAFGEEVPVIDTNVIRIVCRYLGIEEVPSKRAVQKRIEDFLHHAMRGHDPAEFNQAIMNFGALQCRAKSPDCVTCPFNDSCVAHELEVVDILPAKAPKKPRRERFFHYFVIENEDGLVIRRRAEKDIWQGMYDFPLHESKDSTTMNNDAVTELSQQLAGIAGNVDTGRIHKESQVLSHQKIHCLFYPIFAESLDPDSLAEPCLFVPFSEIDNYAVPKVIDCYFRVKSIFL